MADRAGDQDQAGGAVKERVRDKTKEPALYSVVLLNDDYTPMQFVVDVLETVFQKSPAEAYRIMMQVHLERPRRGRHLPVGSGGNQSRHAHVARARGRAPAAGDHRRRVKVIQARVFTRS